MRICVLTLQRLRGEGAGKCKGVLIGTVDHIEILTQSVHMSYHPKVAEMYFLSSLINLSNKMILFSGDS